MLPGEPARKARRRLQLQTAEPEDWRLVIDALAPFIREKRVRSMQRALALKLPPSHGQYPVASRYSKYRCARLATRGQIDRSAGM